MWLLLTVLFATSAGHLSNSCSVQCNFGLWTVLSTNKSNQSWPLYILLLLFDYIHRKCIKGVSLAKCHHLCSKHCARDIFLLLFSTVTTTPIRIHIQKNGQHQHEEKQGRRLLPSTGFFFSHTDMAISPHPIWVLHTTWSVHESSIIMWLNYLATVQHLYYLCCSCMCLISMLH